MKLNYGFHCMVHYFYIDNQSPDAESRGEQDGANYISIASMTACQFCGWMQAKRMKKGFFCLFEPS